MEEIGAILKVVQIGKLVKILRLSFIKMVFFLCIGGEFFE